MLLTYNAFYHFIISNLAYIIEHLCRDASSRINTMTISDDLILHMTMASRIENSMAS